MDTVLFIKQKTVYKWKRYKLFHVSSGVPQRSVLGSVLFLIFVNNMPLISGETDLDTYADDTSMHTVDKDSDIVEQRLQQGAYKFRKGCTDNKMSIVIFKTF